MSATADTRPDPQSLPSWAKSTSGRSGATYKDFLAANPNFDPYTNLESYTGQGGSQSAAAQQAFGWLNEWARGSGYGDGKNIPAAQRGQMYLAFLERARQGIADRGENWNQDAASRIANTGWSYQPGWGLQHGGMSWETQGAVPGAPGPQASGGAVARAARSQTGDLGTASGGGGARTRNGPVAASDNEWGDASGGGATGGAGQRGGSNVSMPGGNPLDPYNPVTNIDPNTGLPAGTPIGPAAVPQQSQTRLPATGTGGGGGLSAIGGDILTNSPEQAWAYMLRQAGVDPNRVTKFSNYAKGLLSPALSSYLNARRQLPGGSVDNVGGYIGDFNQLLGGNQLFSGLADIGRQGLEAGRGLLDTAQPQEAQNFFLQMLGLQGLGASPLRASAQDYLTNSLMDEFEATGLSDKYGRGADKFGSYAQSSGYYDRLKALGLVP